MRYLSLFSGIEAASVAWEPLGWQCVGVAEIEPFPCALLAHHYPDVPNLGSVTEITDEQIAALGPIDIVVGGSPCQDLSVAGKRAGLAGARSGLFHEQLRIFHAARTLCGARWLLWENVPGAFSSHRGRDFAVVVGEMAGAEFGVPRNGWRNTGVAVGSNGCVEWRTLDAQYVRVESHARAVPQRRRRVFALLDTG
jgi:DNA (cytosine-5)-methyltransferase 1